MFKRSRSHHHSARPARRRAFISKRAVMFGAMLVIALMVAAVLWFNSSNTTTPPATSVSVTEISAQEAYQQYQQGAFILDVRAVEEWDAFHIPGAVLIPLGQLAARVSEVPNDRQVIVVCASGSRSRSGGNILLQAGFTKVSSVAGGLTAWSNAEYPLEGTHP